MKYSLIVAAIAGGALALLAAPAHADGTEHFDFPEQCQTTEETTVCLSESGQFNRTFTPAGHELLVGKGVTSFTITSPQSSYSDSYEYNLQVVWKRGDLHAEHNAYTYTYSQDGMTCTLTDNYTYANGELRHDDPTLSCG
jgi:hypothetical protein